MRTTLTSLFALSDASVLSSELSGISSLGLPIVIEADNGHRSGWESFVFVKIFLFAVVSEVESKRKRSGL